MKGEFIMETRQITYEVFTKIKKRIVPKLILSISILSITAIAYTAFVIHCLSIDISYFNVSYFDDPNFTLIFCGMAFYSLYILVMGLSARYIIKSVKTIRHFHMNDFEAVDLVTDDFLDGSTGKKSTVAGAIFNSNPSKVYLDTFLKYNE